MKPVQLFIFMKISVMWKDPERPGWREDEGVQSES